MEIPEEYTVFCLGLVADLSRCYFSNSQARRAEESKDPLEAERDCSLCIFKDLPCGIANVSKVRAMIRLQQAMKAHVLLNMRKQSPQTFPSHCSSIATPPFVERPGVPSRMRKSLWSSRRSTGTRRL